MSTFSIRPAKSNPDGRLDDSYAVVDARKGYIRTFPNRDAAEWAAIVWNHSHDLNIPPPAAEAYLAIKGSHGVVAAGLSMNVRRHLRLLERAGLIVYRDEAWFAA